MNTHPARIVAGILLITGGAVVAVTAFAIAIAQLLVDAGMTVRTADAALLGDLSAVLPFIIAFAAVNVVAAFGLFAGKAWADPVAIGSAIVAVTVGAIGSILVIVGRDPFASTVTARSTTDGIGILGVFTVAYLAVFALIVFARQARAVSAKGAAA